MPTERLQRLNAILARFPNTPSFTFGTTGKKVSPVLSQLEKYRRDIKTYQKFGVEPEAAKQRGSFLKGLGTFFMTYPRAITSGLSRLTELQKEQAGVSQSAGIGELIKKYNKTPLGDRLKDLVPNITKAYGATWQAGLSSSWFKPSGGKYVDRDTADLAKEWGTSGRHLGEIVEDAAWVDKVPGLRESYNKNKDRWLYKNLLKMTPAGMVGLTGDIALDPFSYMDALGLGKMALTKGGAALATKLAKAAGVSAKSTAVKQGLGYLIRASKQLPKSGKVVPLVATADLPAYIRPLIKATRVGQQTFSPWLERGLPKGLYFAEKFGKKKSIFQVKKVVDEIIVPIQKKYIKQFGKKAWQVEEAKITRAATTLFDQAYHEGKYLQADEIVKKLQKKIDVLTDAVDSVQSARSLSKELPKHELKTINKLEDELNFQLQLLYKKMQSGVHGSSLMENWRKVNSLKKQLEETKLSKVSKFTTRLDKATQKQNEFLGKIIKNEEILGKLPKQAVKEAEMVSKHMYGWGKKAYAKGEIPALAKSYFPGIYGGSKIAPGVFKGETKAVGKELYERAISRSYKTFEEAAKHGLKPDSLEHLIYRTAKQHFNRMGRHDFLEVGAKQFGKTAEELGTLGRKNVLLEKMGRATDDVSKYTDEVAGIKQLKGVKFEPEVAQALGRTVEFITDENLAAMAKVIDYPLRVFKYGATVANLGFHVRNAISNYWLLYLKDGIGAFNPMTNALGYELAGIETMALKNPKLLNKTIQGLINSKTGRAFTYREIIDEMSRIGILGGFFGEELGMRAVQPIMQTAAKRVASKVVHAPTKLGSFVEDGARITGYLNDMFKYNARLGTQAASEYSAKRVWKFLYDYGEITVREQKYGKRFAPFYTWLRKNTALQVEQLIKQPGKFSFIGKIKNFVESASEDVGVDEKYLPDYFRKGDYWRTPTKDKYGNQLYWNPNIAFQDLNKFSDVGGELWSIMNPLLRVPIEMKFNKNLFFGSDIESGSGLTAAPLPNIPGLEKVLDSLPKSILDMFKIYKSKDGEYLTTQKREYISRMIPALYNMAKSFPMKGQETPYTRWRRQSWLTGTKFAPYEEEKEKERYYKEDLSRYQLQIRKLKKLGILPEDFTIQDAREGSTVGATEFTKLMEQYRK